MFFQALFTKTTKLLWVLLLVFLLAACNSQTQEPEPEQFAEEIPSICPQNYLTSLPKSMALPSTWLPMRVLMKPTIACGRARSLM